LRRALMAPASEKPAPVVRIKGSTVRAYVTALTKDGHREAVVARLPASTAAMVANPPLAGAWVDFAHIVNITAAGDSIAGAGGVRWFSRTALEEAKGPYIRILEGLLRLFGASPARIFTRMNDLVRNAIDNIDYRYEATSPRSGIMEVRYPPEFEIP